jgi:hypothetical protein
MKKAESVFVVDIFKEVVEKTATELGISINYVPGDAVDIIQNLKDKDSSITLKGTKYVLFALYTPFPERRGEGGTSSLYADVTIRRIAIATLTNQDDETLVRYENTFKPILYPVYEAFLSNFAKSRYISSKDPNLLTHTKTDMIGHEPITGMNDFVDCIYLDNFQFSVNQTKFC